MDDLRIGTSGWQYDHWRETFYPAESDKRDWFSYYSGLFDTVELNTTFYHLPKPASVDGWHDVAPPGFRYAVKLSRYATHIKKLKDPSDTLAPFLERVERLKSFLGPILVQLPPRWRPDAERLDAFLRAAPSRHRWTVEVRDGRWLCEEIYAVLAEHDAALCIHDLLPDHPRRLTAGWLYLRFHGDHYRGAYGADALREPAGFIADQLRDGRRVWAFFNNDEAGHAPADAAILRDLVAAQR